MRSPSSYNCLHCKELFIPSPKNRQKQRYCQKADCRKASKVAAQAKWLRKEQNRRYFLGPENAERVRQWRQIHPGYWRKKSKPGALQHALQDFVPGQVVENEPLTVHEGGVSRGGTSRCSPLTGQKGGTLQDFVGLQVPLLAGVISLLGGDALQDHFEVFARQLVDRGKRVLGVVDG